MSRISAYIAAARKFCLDHPSIVTGACAALGLALTGHVNEAIATISAVVVGAGNGAFSRGVNAAVQK